MNSINDTMAGVLMHLQENYGQLMPHEILEQEDIFKKTNYNLHGLIVTVLLEVEEILEFADNTRTSYTQLQAVNISYMIIHRTEKFGMEIHKWNRMLEIQKTRVRFKIFFRTYHRELRELSYLTIEDSGMHHAKMVKNVL